MKKIAVYGSLLTGLGNHGILSRGGATLVSEETVNVPYGMISYGAFPALVPSAENHEIKIEIFECDDNTYRRVEILEGYPSFYQKYTCDSSLGEVELYVINQERSFETQPENIKVDDGDWRTFHSNKTKIPF